MKQIRIPLLVVVLLLAMTATSFGQLAKEGTPRSFGRDLADQTDTRITGVVDVEAYLEEDRREAEMGLPFRFGAPFDVDYGLNNAGTWEELDNGDRVWRIKIVSRGAHSINLIYNDFYMPPGAELYVYSADRTHVIGAFTEANNKPSGLFATAPVKGDAITVEYLEPSAVRGQGSLRITRIVHAYRDMFGFSNPDKDYGDAGTCNVNVNCSQGAAWQLQKRSVAMVLLGNGTRYCSGAMVNNVRQDGKPYFLTANHCLNAPENWIIMFKYESPTCTNADGPTSYTVHGTTLRATNTYSDFALVELSETPPSSYDVFYAGWSNIDVAASSAVGIHHPSGDIKKISFENNALTSTSYLGTSGLSHWRVADWDVGTTEGGSSGSPLFDPNHRLIGQLHGGYAACGNNSADWYGKFADSWDYGSSASNRLQNWLDPDNTGATTLDGYDPLANPVPVANFSGTPTSGNAPLAVTFTDLSTGSPTSWAWTFGDGGTSTAQNPSHTYTSAGTYTVTLTATNAYGSDGETKTNYITVTTPSAPTAAFTGTPTSGTAPLAVTFTDQSTGSPTSWSWNFGDGGTSTVRNPSHTYTAAGTYTVTLTATNAYGSDGETKTNYITVTEASTWTTITYDSFESGWGTYSDGGGDCSRYTAGTYAYDGTRCLDIQDNSGTASSFYHTSTRNVSGYTEMEVEFYFIAVSMESGEDFWVQYYNGSAWQTIATFARGTHFSNGTFYNVVIPISRSSYTFPTNARLRFMCDASDNNDDVYIDAIEWRGSSSAKAMAAMKALEMPETFTLSQNYPNPFNPTTEIAFTLPDAAHVRLDIYNIRGQLVATLADEEYGPGEYTVTWNAGAYASGVYFYRLTADEFVETRKMMLLK